MWNKSTVLTVPAYFHGTQRRIIMEAGMNMFIIYSPLVIVFVN